MNHRINFVLIGMVLIVVLFGSAEALRDYHLATITGSAISGDFEIDAIKEAVPPVTAVLLRAEDQNLKQEVYELIYKKDDLFLLLDETTFPPSGEDDYLFIEWDNKLNLLSFYMKNEGEGESNFEIWGPANSKIASGELTKEYKWYHFEVSSSKMSSSNYAFFSSGGEGLIKIDKI